MDDFDDDLRWEHVGQVSDWEANSVKLIEIGARKIGVYFQMISGMHSKTAAPMPVPPCTKAYSQTAASPAHATAGNSTSKPVRAPAIAATRPIRLK